MARKAPGATSAKRASRPKSRKSATPDAEETVVSQPVVKAADRHAPKAPEATVRLKLRRSVSRGGKIYGPGEADVPASLAESLKLGGAEEV